MYRRHRAGGPPPNAGNGGDDDEDDEEEDVFSALSRRPKKKSKASSLNNNNTSQKEDNRASPAASTSSIPEPQTTKEEQEDAAPLVASTTSSMKRHHKEMSTNRKAKMDAMLQELQWEQQQEPPQQQQQQHVRGRNSGRGGRQSSRGNNSSSAVTGSHVEPGQEHLTTNLFVGNLAPNITEEDVAQVFGQFGELYSVKIMWPRTAEERARQRLTGFVCYYHRPDAEEAMAAFSEADPFRNGRRLMLRWGKSVLKNDKTQSSSNTRRNSRDGMDQPATMAASSSIVLSPGKPQIQVQIPPDESRAQFIALVASFVAKDGADLEERLFQEQRSDMQFLLWPNPSDANNLGQTHHEHIYYRWRVYSFAQGDSEFTWRTEPFVMVQNGIVWIPPPIPPNAAEKEQERQRQLEEERRQQRSMKRDTKARRPPSSSSSSHVRNPKQQDSLDPQELEEFHVLTRQQLCASREAIARAMAFCFEKSHAAPHISQLLQDLFLQKEQRASVETRIARLYLLSDILFNSQQPGVRNAFYYRDQVERMAPAIFARLGANTNNNGPPGRLSKHKMTKAVSAVLSAWTNWSVYSPAFLDELQARYEGREILVAVKTEEKEDAEHEKRKQQALEEEAALKAAEEAEQAKAAGELKTGDWKDVDEDAENDQSAVSKEDELQHEDAHGKTEGREQYGDADGDPFEGQNDDPDGIPLDDDDDADGEPLAEGEDNVDGEPIDNASGLDGQPLGQNSNDDLDGEPL